MGDGLERSEMDNFEFYRKKNIKHAYYCRHCNRSFDTKSATESCRFCGSNNLKELLAHQKFSGSPKPSKRYRYHCPSCDNTMIITFDIEHCPNCGSKYLHKHEAEELTRREGLALSMNNTLDRVRDYIKNAGLSRADGQNKSRQKSAKKQSKRRSFDFSFDFFGNNEEMPTT